MISVKHPIEGCNEEQELFLSKCPESKRRIHELFFTLGNATFQYHRRAKEYKPDKADWDEWIECLEGPVKSGMNKLGFEKGRLALPFTRYVLERNDIGLDEFLANTVPAEDLKDYNLLIKP